MANGTVANPRKSYNFKIEIDGVDQYEVQKITTPEGEIAISEHGNGNSTIKTPGMVSFGNIIIEKLRAMDKTDNWAMFWFDSTQSARLGGGGLPSLIKRNLVLKEMDSTGTIVLSRHIFEGCFPTKYKFSDFDRMNKEGNTIETVELSCDKWYVLD